MSWDLGVTDLEKADDGGPMSVRTRKQNPRPTDQPPSIPPELSPESGDIDFGERIYNGAMNIDSSMPNLDTQNPGSSVA
jgi:hypothetical protein